MTLDRPAVCPFSDAPPPPAQNGPRVSRRDAAGARAANQLEAASQAARSHGHAASAFRV